MTLPYEVTINPAHHRFELTTDGALATLTYERTDHTLVLVHTEVPPARRGRGLGGQLVEAAADFAAEAGLAVEARCQFAQSWLDRHDDVANRLRVALDQK